MPLAISTKSLKKMTLDELKAFSGEYLSSSIPEKCEKSKMKLLLHLNASIAAETTKPKVVSAASVDLITIGRNMHRRFDAMPHIVSGIDVVIIENQLSTLATRMKTLQGMITQYFIMRGVPDIRFISAINKLKLFDQKKEQGQGDEDCYADRKKRSIEITRELLSNAAHIPLMSMKFEKHKKKDDLADCFLQGMWWLCKGR
jgi:Poxvirus A22 protein